MKPPRCGVCGATKQSAADGVTFRTVKFANYEPLPPRRVGHPKGLVWICSDHLDAAKARTAMSSSEAIMAVRELGGE